MVRRILFLEVLIRPSPRVFDEQRTLRADYLGVTSHDDFISVNRDDSASNAFVVSENLPPAAC